MYPATFIFHSTLFWRFVHVNNVDLVVCFLKNEKPLYSILMYGIHLLLDIWIIFSFIFVCVVCKVNMAEIFEGKDKLCLDIYIMDAYFLQGQ